MTDIPREPSVYTLTIHAGQQAKHRGISKDIIAETIATGDIHRAHEPHQREFVSTYPHIDDPVGVVVDPAETEIITVQYRYD